LGDGRDDFGIEFSQRRERLAQLVGQILSRDAEKLLEERVKAEVNITVLLSNSASLIDVTLDLLLIIL
jgi:hypothetical protein